MEIALLPGRLLGLFSGDQATQFHLNILFSSLLVLFSLLACGSPFPLAFVPHICLAQYLFGLPCPGCGIMHSLVAFSRFDLRVAWADNPVGPFLGAYLCFQVPARMLAISWTRSERAVVAFSSVASRALVVGLLVVWVYRILHGSI